MPFNPVNVGLAAIAVGALTSCVPLQLEVLGDSITAYSAPTIQAQLDPIGDTRISATPGASAGEMQIYAGDGHVDVAVVELGANDVWRGGAPADAIAYIGLTVAGGYLERGARCVIFVTLPTRTGIPAIDVGFSELNTWFRARPFFADYGAALDADPTLTTDGLHPSPAGQAVYARLVESEVRRCLS